MIPEGREVRELAVSECTLMRRSEPTEGGGQGADLGACVAFKTLQPFVSCVVEGGDAAVAPLQPLLVMPDCCLQHHHAAAYVAFGFVPDQVATRRSTRYGVLHWQTL